MILREIIFGCIVALVIGFITALYTEWDRSDLEDVIKYFSGALMAGSIGVVIITIAYGCMFGWR